MIVSRIAPREAVRLVIANHYMHRKPPISFAFGLIDEGGNTVGCVTFGVPASRHMVIGACPSLPGNVLELNRLWVHDDMERNTESWFIAKALRLLPPKIILSYADTTAGHIGYVYRAANFYYAGWTDMERKTPRYDYISPGKHSRDAFRNGYSEKVRREPKIKYWITTGDKREKRDLERICLWPKLDWKIDPPPLKHKKRLL
jgi:hypothetical protein